MSYYQNLQEMCDLSPDEIFALRKMYSEMEVEQIDLARRSGGLFAPRMMEREKEILAILPALGKVVKAIK